MIGEQISHYRLESKIGAGTFGVVYKGVHIDDPELQVAIKVVQPALLEDPKFVESLKAECRRLDKLDHSGIVRFRDLVVRDGCVAMVLELLEGQDLHDTVQAGPISIDESIRLIEAILSALSYAHSKDVIHRDIKPSNIFLCNDGRVKVLDFGIARAAQTTQATQTGTMKGTLDYMAPERFKAGGGGAHSDVYAMGLVAWELVTGKTACPPGDFPEKLGWHIGVGAVDLRTVRRDCPAWLAEVVGRMCAKAVEDRLPNGHAALEAFRLGMNAGKGQASDRPPSTVAPAAPGTVTVTSAEVRDAMSNVRQGASTGTLPEDVKAPPPQTASPVSDVTSGPRGASATQGASHRKSILPWVVVGVVGLVVLAIGGRAVDMLFTNDLTIDQLAEAEQQADKSANLTTGEFPSVRVASGRYQIGSPKTQRDHERDEFLHDVELDRDFLIGVHEVTQAEYLRVMGSNPSENVGCATCPVERVGWMDAITYCNKLSRLHGLSPAYTVKGGSADSVQWNRSANGYRLPTEAEWEVAARSGDSGRFVKDMPVEKVAWYRGNASRTQPVGRLVPNRAGMYDVSGNVVEWVWDWYDKEWYSSSQAKRNPTGPLTGTRKAARGGSWRRSEVGVRLANRSKAGPTEVNNGLGFRIARNAP